MARTSSPHPSWSLRERGIPLMKSQNFELLRSRHIVLADLAGFAERYARARDAEDVTRDLSGELGA